MSVLEIVRASATVLPLTHSVARELEAMAEPQPKVLNLGVLDDLGLGVDADLEAHDVAALGSSDEAGADFGRALVERADVAGIFVVINNLFAICHGDGSSRMRRREWLQGARAQSYLVR